MIIKTIPIKIIRDENSKNEIQQYATIELIESNNKEAIDELESLQKIVSNDVSEDVFHPSTREMIDLYFKNGWGLGCYHNGVLIGYIMIQLANNDPAENYPENIGFYPNDIAKTACHRGVGVHPDYRGNHIQKILQDTATDLIRKNGNYKYIMCTVSKANNPWSYKNIIDSGYKFKKSLIKYFNGHDREMMLLEL